MDHATFFRQVAERVGCDAERAEALTLAVFQELRDRLTIREVEQAEAQMDARLRSMWRSLDRPERAIRRVHTAQFIGEVRKMAALADDLEAERAVCAVFAVLQRLFGSATGEEGEAGHIMSQLPKDLKRLWIKADRLSRVGADEPYGVPEEVSHDAGKRGQDR